MNGSGDHLQYKKDFGQKHKQEEEDYSLKDDDNINGSSHEEIDASSTHQINGTTEMPNQANTSQPMFSELTPNHSTITNPPVPNQSTSSPITSQSAMTSPSEEEEDDDDESDIPGTSTDEPLDSAISDQTQFMVNFFITEQAAAENSSATDLLRELLPHPQPNEAQNLGFPDESLSDIAITLRRIGDDMSRDKHLNSLISAIPAAASRKVFMKVCRQIFEDGELSWGRIVTVFYFAYRLIMRVINDGIDAIPFLRNVITWATGFLVRRVGRWVISRGGWASIREWLGSNSLMFSALTGASVGVALFYLTRNLK